MTPDLVIVGHVVRDRQPEGYTLGGTASYAALTALRMGYRVGVVTSCRADLEIGGELAQAQWVRVDSPRTTTFENTYRGGTRRQLLSDRAVTIPAEAIPRDWRSCPMVLLGTVAREFSVALAAAFSGSCIVATAQGWLRGWDRGGRVCYRAWRPPPAALRPLSAVVLSEEDVAGDAALLEVYAGRLPLLVVTRGKDGAVLYEQGLPRYVPAFPAREVDPTGAGDVFAASFLLKLGETGDAYAAAVYASCAAALSVEKAGFGGIPTASAVADRLEGRG